MNRREVFRSIAAATVAPALLSRPSPAAGQSRLPATITGPRMNFAQADKIMDELGLDALVLGEGINFRYATGMRPVTTQMGHAPSAAVIVTRREEERLAIVAASFTYYYTLADVDRDSDIPIYLYSAPAVEVQSNDQPDPAVLTVFQDRGDVPLDEIEASRIRATETAVAETGRHADFAAAMRKALKAHGLTKGRVAVDHPRIAETVAAATSNTSTMDADDALRRIRPIKSANEILLMRQSAAANEAAALEALETVRAGGSYRDLRAAFYAAAARRDQRGVFMVVDRTSDELFDAEFYDGQCFLIDCVSEHQGYHGDYGRTVFVGEPPQSMISATRAMADSWDRVRENLKPGLRFSEIQALGQTAMRQGGRSYQIPFNPHSVGLYHTDHVATRGSAPWEDVILEPGMIISVDCPLLESGIGGSAHLEDLMLITTDGSEPINDTGQQVITI